MDFIDVCTTHTHTPDEEAFFQVQWMLELEPLVDQRQYEKINTLSSNGRKSITL